MIRGVDCSHHQGVLDWGAVQGIRFAYCKATEGQSYVDPRYRANYSGASHHGLHAGAYHFAQSAWNSPISEADHFLATIAPVVNGDLPPALDVEGAQAADIATWASDWRRRVETVTGRDAALYCSTSYYSEHHLDTSGFKVLWLAKWGSTAPAGATFWQDTDHYAVTGWPNPVDGDWFKGDEATLTRLCTKGNHVVVDVVKLDANDPTIFVVMGAGEAQQFLCRLSPTDWQNLGSPAPRILDPGDSLYHAITVGARK